MIQAIADLGIHMVISGYTVGSGPVGLFTATIASLALYKLWFAPEFEGMLKGDLPLGFLLGLSELGYVLVSYVPNLIDGSFSLKPLTWVIIITSLTAGIKEEFLFRGVIVSTLLRQWKDRNMFLQATLVSGIVFGLIHAANVLAGADPVQTLLQVIASVGVGIFFAAVYIRCGSILPCMFYHVLHDIIAIAAESNVAENGIMYAQALSWGDAFSLALSFVLAAVGLWLIRGAKTEQIREIWDRKWKLASPAAVSSAVAAATTPVTADSSIAEAPTSAGDDAQTKQ
ncbi:MAG: CPBP family intramembrane metalloprotease [Eubacterium sp.]|nr:CPBP family intramembrane metalloprotease [Eubacterium sp.]